MRKKLSRFMKGQVPAVMTVYKKVDPFSLTAKVLAEKTGMSLRSATAMNEYLVQNKKIICTDPKLGRYRRRDLIVKATDMKLTGNWILVLNALKELGEGTSDDVLSKVGELPNRGIHYSISALKDRGLIEKVRKHENGKGVYKPVTQTAEKPVQAPSIVETVVNGGSIEIRRGEFSAIVRGDVPRETIDSVFDNLKKCV